MKIAHVMTSKIMGGIEQVFLDYNKVFLSLDYDVLSVINKKNVVEDKIKTPKLIINFSQFNPFLVFKIYFGLKKFRPDVIIIHQKKAIPLFRIVARLVKAKLIGVAHNPKPKRLEQCDAIFSVAQNQKEELMAQGITNIPIEAVPNMIELPQIEATVKPFHKPVVIGAFGRFEPIKGFCCLIDALAILKQRNIPFKAIIGGKNNGTYDEEEKRILQKVKKYNLQGEINFCGWVSDKQKFFDQINIFVLTSLYESFGIVLREAAIAKKTIVSSDASGPKEIWHNTDAVKIFEKGNAEMLADKLAELISNPKQAQEMAEKSYRHIKETYSMPVVTNILQEALNNVTKKH